MNSSINEHGGKGAKGEGPGGEGSCLCSLTTGDTNAETKGWVVWLMGGSKGGVGTGAGQVWFVPMR
jgi:hypothetical protein